jgi:hypothetical protein
MQWRLIVARFDRGRRKKRRRSDSDGLTLAAQWVGAASSPDKPSGCVRLTDRMRPAGSCARLAGGERLCIFDNRTAPAAARFGAAP